MSRSRWVLDALAKARTFGRLHVMAVKERSEQSGHRLRTLMDEIARLESDARSLRAAASSLQAQAEASHGLTVHDLATEAGVPEDAVVEFARAVGALLQGRPLSARAARRAATLAASSQIWEAELGPLLSSAQVGELLGGVSRQRVNELLRAKRLIGLHDRAGRLRFPAFKFRDGRPLEPLVRSFWTLRDASLGEWSAASWCVSPDDALDGRSPVQWAHEDMDAERLAQVARQDAARLAW
jgi:hypothetical protein